MEEKEKQTNERNEAVDNQVGTDTDNIDYISAIKEMKKNSVSKDAYKKLQDENKKLLESLIAGETIEAPKTTVEEKVDLNALRKHLDEAESPIDYCKTSLKLHEETLKQLGYNDYLPNGKKIRPTKEDEEKANLFIEQIKECIDYADGDDQLFIQELQRRTFPVLGGH